MSASQTPDAHDVDDVPRNIARPRWQCPKCLTDYGTDLEAATQCAQAAQAVAPEQGTPVLLFKGGSQRFAATAVGKVRPTRNEDGTRAHHRDIVVGDRAISGADLAGAIRGKDGLLIVADTRPFEITSLRTRPGMYSADVLAKLFIGENRWGWHSGDSVKVWVDDMRTDQRYQHWVSAPNEQQRAALNVVTGGFVDKVLQTDEDTLTTDIRGRYSPQRSNRHASGNPADVVAPAGGLMLAEAHGATTHIWSLRWLNAHLDDVCRWQAQTLRDWAAGTGAPIPFGVSPRVPQTMPKNPGKRRLAVMEPYGWDYHQVRDAIIDQLTTDAPVNPVPGVDDVPSTLRSTQKEGADDV